jgi:tetratricopeptide (TPR) repeat protein
LPASKPTATAPPVEQSGAPALQDKQPGSPSPARSKIKTFALRILAAVLVPLLCFCMLELILHLVGFGYPKHFFLHESFNGQKIIHENQQFGWRFFPPVAARTPRPVVLSRTKPSRTCRVFVFGESAAYGDPAPAFGLPRVLEVLLRNRYPNVNFEVVNVAMTAINSNVLLPIARDCAGEEGDVWVVYMGNNEVVGPYGAGTVFGPQAPGLAFIRASIGANASRTGQLIARMRDALLRKSSAQPTQIGLELFLENQLRHDDARMTRVYGHFARNLADILDVGTKAGAKIVVSTVASNLKDCAPFASLHRAGLTPAEKSQWASAYEAGIKAEQSENFPQALTAYGEAAKIDDQWADLQFRQARVLWNSSDFAGALRHFVLARDYDALRFRADSRINDTIRRLCSERLKEGMAFLDGNGLLAQHSPHGILGQELLFEHVHLNFSGNYWLARGFAEQITETLKPTVLLGQVPTGADWLSQEECSRQLGLNDWDRYQMLQVLRQRLDGPPFTLQLNHAEQSEHIQNEIARYTNSLFGPGVTLAVQSCENALAVQPKDWVLHQKLAQILTQSSEKPWQARALEEWRKVIALVPHYPEAHYELGVLSGRAGQLKEAETQLGLAVNLKRHYYPNALNALGQVLASQNRLTEALDNYQQAIRQKSNFPDALVNSGVVLNRLGKKADAQSRFEEALRLAPKNAEAAVHLGQMLDQSGDVTTAIARYTELLRSNPDNAGAHYNLARCYTFLGRSGDAQQHYAEALRVEPEFVEAHTQLGMELFKAGKEAEALGHFSEAVRLRPDSASTHKDLGVALAKLRRFAEAAQQFEAALRLEPGDSTAQTYLQAARRAQGTSK